MLSPLIPPIGLLPVLLFLLALVYFDSYKLTKLSSVVGALVAGGMVAGISFFANGALMKLLHLDLHRDAYWVAPVVEESLKAAVMVFLFRSHRIGFLVDGAIMGFAVGAGFAVVENFYYLLNTPGANMAVWVVRGFGTAFMHGAVTATFAVLLLVISETREGQSPLAFLPGLLVAVGIHALFNHFFVSPIVTTAVTLLVLPIMLYEVFIRSEKRLGRWLGTGFDADAEMLGLLNSGGLSNSPLGQYLHTLQGRFKGPIVADILCYVRLHTELALRAKGLLLMRENGFEVAVDDATRAKFLELQYLAKSIGATGLMAIQPVLHTSRKDLWQLYMLDEQL